MKSASETNRLLAQLPRRDREDVLEHCQDVELMQGQVLAQPGEPVGHVYFPRTSSIARVVEAGGGSSLGVALIGNEGMFGASLLLGIASSPARAVVQSHGSALRMSAARFRMSLTEGSALRRAGHSYLFVLFDQLARTSGCTRFHLLEHRLARWLLMTSDRAGSSTFHMTHEFLAHTLGVRRVGITRAATDLQRRKLIHYARGEIVILDRKGLVKAACACYAADLASYQRVLG
ncbi:MAG TPA: Crp/Fnr family transcriptional regulator [Usitatibacter sp.]|jgi:CRP-like cAMP-binding protein|nr:Crp/Fnr family transcriptional regulator [Usitatibacter sp.]